MADKYVVNNAGLVATANAIRAKTGDSAGIVWDDSQGFASAIETISGEAQILTGSFVVRNITQLRTEGFMLQGVNFTAKKIVIYRTDYLFDLASLTPEINFVVFAELRDLRTDVVTPNDMYSCHTLSYLGRSDGGGYISSANSVSLLHISDGYAITQWFQDPGDDLYMAVGTYNWVAVG